MPPEDDPRDDVQTWPCRKCEGTGRLVVGYDGNHGVNAMTCPRCNGSGDDPDPTTP
jgi:DnaJ-class molecular chaperone